MKSLKSYFELKYAHFLKKSITMCNTYMNLNLLVIKSMYEFNWRRPVLCLSDLLTLEGKGQVSKHTRGFLFVG